MQVKLDRSSITIPGQMVRIEGQGMPVYGDELHAGALIVTFVVEFPSHLTEQQKQTLKSLLA